MADTKDTATSGATTSGSAATSGGTTPSTGESTTPSTGASAGSHTGTGGESQNTPDPRAYAQDTAGAETQNLGDGTFEVTPTVEQLAWGDLKLSVSENGVMGLNDGFSTAIKVNTETNDDKEGRPATNTQTIELQEISFDFLLNAYFLPKTTIEKEWEKWKKQIAKHHPLYLNGKQFGPKELQLIEADLTDSKLDDYGRFLVAHISIKLREWAPEKAKSKKTASTKSKGKSKSKGTTSKSKKSSAKSVGPSKSAKAAKKK